MKKYVDMGFAPTCRTYNSIINGFIKEDDIDSALDMYREMCNGGVSLDVVIYTR